MASSLRILPELRSFLAALLMFLSAAMVALPVYGEHATEILPLEQEIHFTRNRLTQVAAELRDAKVLAAEKLMEVEAARDQFQQDNSSVNANTLDHSQQRLALAEMGVEARTAKFERIQKRLEELAQLHQQHLEQPATPTLIPAIPAKTETASTTSTPAKPQPSQSTSDLPTPVFALQGKLTDALVLSTQLQKLERHLMTAGIHADPVIKVKAFGTAIPGELNLSPLGGNQYFARFIAPAGQVSLIVGVRLEQYHRNTLALEFLPQEQGEEFVLIFDMNQPDNTRALVFPEAMMFGQNLFAAHNDY